MQNFVRSWSAYGPAQSLRAYGPHIYAWLPWFSGKYAALYFTGCRWFSGEEDVFDTFTIFFFIGIAIVEVMRHCDIMQTQSLDMIQFMLSSMSFPRFMAASSRDVVFKQRGLAMYAIGYRSMLPHVFHGRPGLVVAYLILLIDECVITKFSFDTDGTDMPPRVYFTLAIGTFLYIMLGSRLHQEWTTLSCAQQALAVEKAAQEALISMLCDFCVHVDVDGDTVTRGSAHLDAMMGHEIKVEKLTDHLPDSGDERARVVEAFQRANKSPVNLPVSLLSRSSVENRLDMFIVRRSAIDDNNGIHERRSIDDVGFLVGFRFARDEIHINSSPMELYQPCPEDVANEVRSTEDDQSSQSKVGAVFPESALKASSSHAGASSSRMDQSAHGALIVTGGEKNPSTLPIDVNSPNRLELTRLLKNTFIHFEDDMRIYDTRSVRSAPPLFYSGPDPDFIVASDEISIVASSSSKSTSVSGVTIIHLGHSLHDVDSLAGMRLSDLLSLKKSGLASIGSTHALVACMPCQFFHSPRYCRASWTCGYCHNIDHFKQLPRKLRKMRPEDRQSRLAQQSFLT